MGKPFMGYKEAPPENIRIETFLNQNEETRYIVINADTGEVFDDAQGYGYKTEEKARNAFNYASNRRMMYGGVAWQ